MSLKISEADLANPDDALAVLVLLQTYALDPMGGGEAIAPDLLELLIPRLRTVESRLVLLARVDGRPAGLAIAFRVFSTFKAAPVLNLHDLAVHSEFRGQGVGRELLKRIELHATRTGCCRVSLEVRVDNEAAQALYRSQGFGPGEPMQEFWIKPLV
ncbi:MAG: GNAT family N-acetyltransferase [Planctomycetota bacterium]